MRWILPRFRIDCQQEVLNYFSICKMADRPVLYALMKELLCGRTAFAPPPLLQIKTKSLLAEVFRSAETSWVCGFERSLRWRRRLFDSFMVVLGCFWCVLLKWQQISVVISPVFWWKWPPVEGLGVFWGQIQVKFSILDRICLAGLLIFHFQASLISKLRIYFPE